MFGLLPHLNFDVPWKQIKCFYEQCSSQKKVVWAHSAISRFPSTEVLQTIYYINSGICGVLASYSEAKEAEWKRVLHHQKRIW